MSPDDSNYERTLFATRGEYAAAADRIMAMAQREIRIFDPDLSEFRLESPARIELLKNFLVRSRDNRVRIALHDPDHVMRYCPRLLGLLATYSGFMLINRTLGDAARTQDCFILSDRLHVVRRPVAKQPRGVLLVNDPAEGQGMHNRFEEIWESSEPGASASASGL